MAKAGFWLRGSRGKLAGAVTQKGQNGTIIRENVTPKNPRTDKQLYQRAVMATVMQAMKAGKEIFNHAFQGKEVGQKSLQYFVAKNAVILRGAMEAELAAATAPLQCSAAAVAPKAFSPVPNEYLISEGTYEQSFFGWDGENNCFKAPEPETDETPPAYAARTGLIAGDIYTFVFFGVVNSTPAFVTAAANVQPNVTFQPGSQYNTQFGYIRLQVKDTIPATGQLTIDKLFEVTAVSGNADAEAFMAMDAVNENITPDLLIKSSLPASVDDHQCTVGCIRSRADEDLRSTSYMHAYMGDLRTTSGVYGIMSPHVLDAWKQGSGTLGNSQLILEGGDE